MATDREACFRYLPTELRTPISGHRLIAVKLPKAGIFNASMFQFFNVSMFQFFNVTMLQFSNVPLGWHLDLKARSGPRLGGNTYRPGMILHHPLNQR